MAQEQMASSDLIYKAAEVFKGTLLEVEVDEQSATLAKYAFYSLDMSIETEAI